MLGIVLTPYGQIPGAPPWGIAYSYGGDGTFLCPDDPYFNTRGEPGLYYDTQLGSPRTKRLARASWSARLINKRIQRALTGLRGTIPTDAELWATYGYVPMINGEVVAKEGFQPSSWIPPNGWNPAGAFGPAFLPMADAATANAPYGLSGIGDATTTNTDLSPTDAAAISALVDEVEQHNNNVLILTILSTAAVVISAIVTTVRNAHLYKQEKRLVEEEEEA